LSLRRHAPLPPSGEHAKSGRGQVLRSVDLVWRDVFGGPNMLVAGPMHGDLSSPPDSRTLVISPDVQKGHVRNVKDVVTWRVTVCSPGCVEQAGTSRGCVASRRLEPTLGL